MDGWSGRFEYLPTVFINGGRFDGLGMRVLVGVAENGPGGLFLRLVLDKTKDGRTRRRVRGSRIQFSAYFTSGPNFQYSLNFRFAMCEPPWRSRRRWDSLPRSLYILQPRPPPTARPPPTVSNAVAFGKIGPICGRINLSALFFHQKLSPGDVPLLAKKGIEPHSTT